MPNFIFLQTHSLRLTTKWGRTHVIKGEMQKFFVLLRRNFAYGRTRRKINSNFIHIKNESRQGIHQKIVIKRKDYVPESSFISSKLVGIHPPTSPH